MPAVRRPEGIVHVRVGKVGKPAGEPRIICLFARIESEVLQQDHVGVRKFVKGGCRTLGKLHVAAEELGEARRDRRQREVGVHRAARTPEVRGADEPCTGAEEFRERWDRGRDAAVIADGATIEGYVEIDAYEYPAPGYVTDVIERAERHSLDATSSTRSTTRFE
jgi:hypothetical protein